MLNPDDVGLALSRAVGQAKASRTDSTKARGFLDQHIADPTVNTLPSVRQYTTLAMGAAAGTVTHAEKARELFRLYLAEQASGSTDVARLAAVEAELAALKAELVRVPVAAFGYTIDGLVVTYTAIDQGPRAMYAWNLGVADMREGVLAEDGFANGRVVKATYGTAGSYIVSLAVVLNGKTAQTNQTILIPEAKPAPMVADYTYAVTGWRVAFTAKATSQTATYAWDLGVMTPTQPRYATGANVTADYPHGGPRTVTLTVTDGAKTATASKTIMLPETI